MAKPYFKRSHKSFENQNKMEMNPFKTLVQFCEGVYEKTFG